MYPPGHSSVQSLGETLPSLEVLPNGQLIQELYELAPSWLEYLPVSHHSSGFCFPFLRKCQATFSLTASNNSNVERQDLVRK